MSDPANMSKEELVDAAWDRWREADYSWDGLLDPLKITEGYSSLQEYWRIDPLVENGQPRDNDTLKLCGELIEENGYTYHIAHLPLHYPDGTPTKKFREFSAVQKQLETIVYARLNAAMVTTSDEADIEKNKAYLQGVVFLSLNLSKAQFPNKINAKFNHCFFASNEFQKDSPSNISDFEGADFVGTSPFANATFLTEARFYKATFLGDADFSDALFIGDTRYQAELVADFIRVEFKGTADFTRAKFFKNSLYESVFGQDVRFNSTIFNEGAYFNATNFNKKSFFIKTLFNKNVYFSHVIFEGDVNFDYSNFRDESLFINVIFNSDAIFNKCTFNNDATFLWVNFVKNSKYSSCIFLNDALFAFSKYQKEVTFPYTKFYETAEFNYVTWPIRHDDYHHTFYLTTFLGPANFTASRLSIFSAFNSAIFKEGLFVDRSENKHSKAKELLIQSRREFLQFMQEVRENGEMHSKTENYLAQYYFHEEDIIENKANKSYEKNLTNNFKHELNSIICDKSYGKERQEICLEELEGGCRILKLAAEKMSDHASAQLFHRFELMAREKQAGTGGSEKFFAFFYGLFSDYGANPLFPLCWIIGFFVLFGAVFYLIDQGLEFTTHASGLITLWFNLPLVGRQALFVPDPQQIRFDWDNLFSAFSFSLGNTIHPLSALSVENIPSESVAHRLLTRYGEGWSFATLVLAGLQSLLAIILLFMLGVSVRRRFQVS